MIEAYPPEFYAAFDNERYALCFECHLPDMVRSRAGTGVTGFRDGDLNLHYLHVTNPKNGRSCRACHATHGSDAPKHIRAWVPIVSLAKGLEQGSLLRMTEVINEVLPGHRAGVLTGPNLAGEIMSGYAAASVISLDDEDTARQLQGVFHSGLFRVYTNPDVVSCEVGGALKNVIAIATGMGDGLGVGDNTRSMVITRGLAELMRLGVAMGGRAETFAGLAGMGDLIATCTSIGAATATSASSSARAAAPPRSSKRCTWWPRA